jgi:hypothetical protein
MCWFEGGVTRSHGEPRVVARGLGLLGGSLSVHDDVDPDRAAAYRAAVADGTLPAGYAIDDGVGLLFEDDDAPRAYSCRPTAGARRVTVDGEEPLEPALLAPDPIAAAPEASISEWREHRAAVRDRSR